MNDELMDPTTIARERAVEIIERMAEESDFYSQWIGERDQITMVSGGEWVVLHENPTSFGNSFKRFDDLEAALMSIDTKAVGEFVNDYDFFLE